jgi:PPK2 family polyphosphate:nucleotide phosphotransferase
MAKKRFSPVKSPYLVDDDGHFKVKRAATAPPKKARDDDTNEKALADAIGKLTKLQAKLAASDSRSLLVVFQAMDAAGKDGTVKAVMTGVNPAGVETHAFKRPSPQELDHDFLWRCQQCLPPRGHIGIWNRSHYEEVLVVRVHPPILDTQRLPDRPELETLFDERYESIRDFEKHLARNGTRIVKFWLNVSRNEQHKRFLARIDDPESNWKFEAGDIRERRHWDDYMKAYERALRETSRPWAPWYAIPADDKRFMRRAVAEILVDTLESMDLSYPDVSLEARSEMAVAKAELEAE